MIRSLFLACLVTAPVMAATITNDTYIDSYYGRSVTTKNGVTTTVNVRNDQTNYGHNAAIKAVSSFASTSFPDRSSNVHALFTLPTDFWSTVGPGPVQTTTVTYYIRNNSLATNATDPATQTPGAVRDAVDGNHYYYRQLELHPLLQPFATLGAGSGGTPDSTAGGGQNDATTKYGPDWNTADGTTPWTTPGAPFDAAFAPSSTLAAANGAFTKVTWDITGLLNNLTARAEIQANGLLICVTDEGYYSGNEFASLISYDSAGYVPSTGTNSYAGYFPTVVTVPEPAALGLLGGAGVLALRRRRQA